MEAIMPVATAAARPDATEYAPYYGRYIELLPDAPIVATLERQAAETLALLRSIPEARGVHRYAPGKWTIKESIAHITDAERVFAYRAMRIARGDATPLASFDENAYAAANRANDRTLADLAEEQDAVRRASICLARALNDEELARRGSASGNPVSARALLWIIAGHEAHHVRLLRERYLRDEA
jgi:uncharacterized damage-inducible protein DinB